MLPKFRRSSRSGVGTDGDAVGGGKVGLPPMLDVNFAWGSIIPTDPGDGNDDGTKFRDLVWVPDDEKVDYVHTQERNMITVVYTLEPFSYLMADMITLVKKRTKARNAALKNKSYRILYHIISQLGRAVDYNIQACQTP